MEGGAVGCELVASELDVNCADAPERGEFAGVACALAIFTQLEHADARPKFEGPGSVI